MNERLRKSFEQLRDENRGGFIPFITAGDPDLNITGKLILEFARIGATVIELGVPFSDPMADGPTIQLSAERALRRNVNVKQILDLVAEVRGSGCAVPIVLFSYFNPILRFGLENFVTEAARSGVDGILITDLVPEESGNFRHLLTENDLSLITLAAPTSSDERLQKIADAASGFVYAVARAGVTGVQNQVSGDAETLVKRLRKFTNLPIAVGFGISTRSQATEVCSYADAAVVGSAIVSEIARLSPLPDQISEDFVEKIGAFAHSLLPGKIETV